MMNFDGKTAVACAAAAIMCMFGAAPAAQEALPESVREAYPQDDYIIRSGTGATPEEAAQSARFEIARYFESSIEGATVVRQQGRIESSGGDAVEKYVTEMSNEIVVSTSREIPGIEIAATEEKGRGDGSIAWAVLGIDSHRAWLLEQLAENDRAADAALARARQADGDLARLKQLTAAVNAVRLRERHRSDLRVLGAADGIPSRANLLAGTVAGIDSLVVHAIGVGMVFEGEVDTSLRRGIVKGVVDTGIRLQEYMDAQSARAAGADLLLVARHEVNVQETGYSSFTFHNADWVFSLDALDPARGAVMDVLVLNDKVAGAANESQARERMVRKMLDTHVPQIRDWVYRLLFTPEE